MFRKFSILLLIVAVFSSVSCKKKKTVVDPIPYQTVYIKLYPNDPLNFKIQAIGGWIYVSGGVNGIIVYRKSNAEFIALERTSTYLPNDAGALAKVRPDNFTCRDTVSGSEWQIIDGAVTKAPATLPLKQYHTNYDGNLLLITN
ncbi:MAG: hypothetical protein JST26_02870 [Bacteroidetes bacterium]|nr:hypothetical protein [Bacteroidota bacterium]